MAANEFPAPLASGAGRKIELVVEDDAGDPKQAVTEARKLVELDHVSAIAGPLLCQKRKGGVRMATRAVHTSCHECWLYCGALARVDEDTNRIEAVVGDPEHPLNRGFLCPKGRGVVERIYNPDRILHPLKRVGERGEGKWEQISWEKALDEISDAILDIRQKYGRKALAMMPGYIVENPLWALFLRYLGCNNYINCLDRCDGGAFIADYAVFGRYLASSITFDFENSACVLLWGSNPAHSLSPYWQKIRAARKRGAKIISVDPVFTEASEIADLWLQPRPGTDPMLALSMLNVIVQEKLYNADFVSRWCTGFERVREHVMSYSPEKAEEITEVPASQIRDAARMFALNGPACIGPHRNGACQKINGMHTYLAHSILMAITGNVDIPGGGIFNTEGLEGFITEGQLIYGSEYRLPPEVESETWGHKDFPLLRDACLLQGNSTRMWEAMREGEVKALFVVRSDPAMTHADTRQCVEDLKKLDLLVVPNFHMGPTAELADYVLPAATWCERDDVRTGYLCTSVVQKVIEPRGESWADDKIAMELVKSLKKKNYPHVWNFPWQSVEEYLEHRLKGAGITFEELKKIGFITYQKKYRRYERGGFQTPSGKIELVPSRFESYGYSPLPEYLEPEESPVSTPALAKEYPLILITGSRSLCYYSSSHRDVKGCRSREPHPLVRFHPDTAREYAIQSNDWCWIVTPRGRVKMLAEVTEKVKPGVVIARHGWWFPEDKSTTLHALNDSNINLVTFKGIMDNVIGVQHMKSLLCTLEKAQP